MGNKIMLELSEEQEKLLKFALIRLEADVSKNENYDLNNNLFYDDLANQVWKKTNSKGIDYTTLEPGLTITLCPHFAHIIKNLIRLNKI